MTSKLSIKTFLVTFTLTIFFSLAIYFIIIPIIKEEAYNSEARLGLNTLNNIKSIFLLHDIEFIKKFNRDEVFYTEEKEILADKLRKYLTIDVDGIKIKAYVFDKNSKIVLHPNPFLDGSDVSNIKLKDQDEDFATKLKEQAHKNKTLQYIWDKEQDPGNYKYQKISWIEYSKELDMYFITSAYLDDINANAKKIEERIVLVVIIITFLSWITGYLTINSFLKPLTILSKVAKRVKAGDLNARSKIKGNDEVAQLSRTFDMMVEQIENTIETLDAQVAEKTKEIEKEKFLLNSIMNSQPNIVLTSEGLEIQRCNKSFLEFFNINSIDEFKKKYGNCICDTFENKSDKNFIYKTMNNENWIDYILNNPKEIHKALIKRDDTEHIFSISANEFKFENNVLKTSVFSDITEIEKIQNELKYVYNNLTDSIKYASIIQKTLLPQEDKYNSFFKDSFVIWEPKDIVGGDIYLFETLRDKEEALLMVIDCTGHGVAGAFVTMLVKAIEKDIVSNIMKNDYDISPSIILEYFNKTMKKLLNQDSKLSLSDVGFDGGVIYINKKKNILKFAGANTPLFYTLNNEIKSIKGDRMSIGYKHDNYDFKFKEHHIPLNSEMKFYITTDGYIDQKGGEKGFSFSKKNLIKLLEKNFDKSMSNQKNIFYDSLKIYQNDYFRVDDITFIGLEV